MRQTMLSSIMDSTAKERCEDLVFPSPPMWHALWSKKKDHLPSSQLGGWTALALI